MTTTPAETPTRRGLRIGIVPVATEFGGGIFQYSQTMLSVLADLRQARADEFVVIADAISPEDRLFSGVTWEIAPLTPPGPQAHYLRRVARTWLSPRSKDRVMALAVRLPMANMVFRRPEVTSWFDQLQIDLVLYPSPTPLSFEAETPYVLAVHDLQHRLQPGFPEVSADNEFERREYVFRNGIREATMVLADSEVGREDILNLYGDLIAPDRVAVLPFLPATPDAVSDEDREHVRRKYRLPERFLFYPAQMWPHKNHLRLVQALAELERSDGIEAHLVLTGATSGEIREETYAELMASVRALRLNARVHYLGYAPATDVAALFAEAVALVMPTFFGPTNIPVLEAWSLGCPVVTSDIRGVREQAGDAALLADPRSVDAIADAIRRVWVDDDLRAELVRRGQRRLALYTRGDYARRLSEVLDRAGALVAGS
jgi:glycosyltransferase involved in cell wall biosynthesis